MEENTWKTVAENWEKRYKWALKERWKAIEMFSDESSINYSLKQRIIELEKQLENGQLKKHDSQGAD